MITFARHEKRLFLTKGLMIEDGYIRWRQQISKDGFLIGTGYFRIDDSYYNNIKSSGAGMIRKMQKNRREWLEREGK